MGEQVLDQVQLDRTGWPGAVMVTEEEERRVLTWAGLCSLFSGPVLIWRNLDPSLSFVLVQFGQDESTVVLSPKRKK